MDIDTVIDRTLRPLLRRTVWVLELKFLERLSYSTRRTLSAVFFGAHFLVLALFIIEARELAWLVATLLAVIWGALFGLAVLVYMPLEGFVSLYDYLRKKELPPSHAALVTSMTVVGVISTALFLLRASG